jgi:signal transduction histidine kinase
MVDDTEENLVALEALLRRNDVELLKARSGAQALELLLAHDVSLALLDVQMPEMDGFELAELMRGMQRTKHVPIIFITAGTRDPKRVFKGYESGAVDFLFKPVEPHTLRSKVEVFLELARQRQELAQALRLNELFVGVVGHDLRNPLNAMMTGVELLQQLGATDMQARALGRMQSAGKRMTEMIEQLLDLTRARLGGGIGFVRTRHRVDLRELVQRAADELRGASGERRVHVHASDDATTVGDADRLLQMFSNVLGNATTHGQPDRPIHATIASAGSDLVVQISNDGAIPPEVLPKVFEPFRGDARRNPRAGGLGLGMFIARQIALAHDGEIDAEATSDDRTIVTIRLPRIAADTADHPDDGAPTGSGGGGGSGGSVLIVEDETELRETLREAFERNRYRVATATNGREALDLLLRDSAPLPDVCVVDLVMPVLDGGELYRAMQANPKLSTIPVVMPTANPASAPAGPVVLPKPVKLARLLAEVARLV